MAFMPPTTDVAELSYEQARDELVRVVGELEQGSATLEQSLALWERGEALAARCEEWLIGAKARLDAARAGAQRPAPDDGGEPLMARHEPRVVAELGRPETPEETADRRAENSRKHRQRQTLNNLILALGASLLVVLVIVLIVPRNDTPIERDIDVAAVAEQAQIASDDPLAVPELPEGWRSNAAELRRSEADGVTAWYAGYLTPSDEYVGLYQGLEANPTWASGLLARTLATGTTTIGGVEWTVYDNRETGDDVGNAKYGLTTEAGGSTFVLLGTATTEEFEALAAALVPTIEAQH